MLRPTRSDSPRRSTWPTETSTPRPGGSPGLDSIGLDDPPTLELKARLLKAQGKPAEAVDRLEKAFDAAGSSPGSLEFGRGVVRLLNCPR